MDHNGTNPVDAAPLLTSPNPSLSPTGLRILTLNYEFPPIGGGGGNAHRHLLQEFARFPDLRVTLLGATVDPQLRHETISPNVDLHLLPLPKRDLLYWRRSEIIYYLMSHYRFLRRHLQDHHYDLCHVFFGFPCGLLAYLYRANVPYIVSVRGSDVPGFNPRFSKDYVFLHPLLRRIYRSSRAVIANSDGLRELYEQAFPGLSAQVIPNGIDTRIYAPLEPEPRPEPILVTVARLIPRKGIDLLLRACRLLQEQGIAFRCRIVGDGPEEDSLKILAFRLGLASQVEFLGRMDRTAISRLLPQCDLFVLPSHAEGMSNAALEAMACGLPLVLTDTGGAKELVLENGVIVPPGNEYPLASVLSQILGDPVRRKEMGKQSRIRAESFSWHNVARRYHDLYYEVLERQCPS